MIKIIIITTISFFLVNCSTLSNKPINRKNIMNIDIHKSYSFREYVNLISRNSELNDFPNINDISD